MVGALKRAKNCCTIQVQVRGFFNMPRRILCWNRKFCSKTRKSQKMFKKCVDSQCLVAFDQKLKNHWKRTKKCLLCRFKFCSKTRKLEKSAKNCCTLQVQVRGFFNMPRRTLCWNHKFCSKTKGQLISKCFMVSPKKRTDKFAFSIRTAFRDAKRR